ncbi:hypothetical protein SAMN05443377_10754 [Propionibacterium cyclohexanicum]|uniref:Nitroimidazol reductase NimA, pyridoxamine 5'-phosphate oxidase superfamily n=1 Tax=Propionibacterium cyclohexanicum TaxID=64702 RepID=A0A1H9RGK8_9ACTN|nr:pyridoxamine 5'-phosphate oxidase family protein [Propionibacterium cyclohexanicum]SER71848.1 hypothetical protein SAMN05443377_10754 [Propionibacterium cyclohexanicum]
MRHEIHRHADRASHDRTRLDALLDAQCFGTLSAVSPDGDPWAVPMGYARVGDLIVMHGSTGGGLLRLAAAGAPVVLTVAAMDGYVVGHSAQACSVNYRSATIRGQLVSVTGDEKAALLDAYTDFYFPGRMAEVRPHTAKELAATLLLTLQIGGENWLFKQRCGQASDPGEPSEVWGGVVGLRTLPAEPERAPWSTAPLPSSVARLVERLSREPGTGQ